jgi:uncharacterized protein
MKKIALISDTHSHLPDTIWTYLDSVDEIWHAGDVGEVSIMEALLARKPVRGVYGNIDGQDIRHSYPLDCRFELEGLDIWITHIGGYPGRYSPRVRQILDAGAPDIFICGHSHILRVARDPKYANMLTLNPGAVGTYGFHKIKTFLRFSLHQGKVSDMQAVELGARARIT